MYSSTLKKYFSKYLLDVRGLSESSVGHYIDALNNISRRLKEKGLVENNIYEILDIEELERVRNILFNDNDFLQQNLRGNHMYSAGLNNYFNFAAGDGFASINEKVNAFDFPMEQTEASETIAHTRKRSNIIRNQAIRIARYECEMNTAHETFIAERTHMPYMEGHHLIPMKWQDEFKYSLDTYANIICLCPLCHRKIHFGEKQDKADMIKYIFGHRESRLINTGIKLTEKDLIDLAVSR